jgi:hypothetical protein
VPKKQSKTFFEQCDVSGVNAQTICFDLSELDCGIVDNYYRYTQDTVCVNSASWFVVAIVAQSIGSEARSSFATSVSFLFSEVFYGKIERM